jgi:periplasmic protein TonB
MSYFEDERRPSRRLWALAAAGALALHLGGAALALAHLRDDAPGAQLGAQGIEVGLVFGSEKTEDTDLPPGPETNESTASPELAEQKAVKKETDLPKAKPVESETPDRVVTNNDSKKPTEEEPEVATVAHNASDPSVAQEATARVNLDEKGDGIIEQGLLRDRRKAESEWNAQISACIERQKNRHYPKNKSKNVQVTTKFVLNRLGNIIDVSVMGASGDAAFEQAAIAMIRSCDPMPKPPAKLTEDTFTRTVLVKFNERK